MAKKLVYNYVFNPSAGTIVIKGNYPLKTLQLITNVTDNEIIYNFADSTKGATFAYDTARNETTYTLTYSTASMSSTDQLQIFIDVQEEKIDVSETFTDPVSKIRVSNPQNLIDTDFEYGLQPTKWETVELVNNVPSFYSSSNDYSIADVTSVTSELGSEFITVTTQEEHGLTVGSPIDVQGLSSRTAEGKFLVTKVINLTTFVYKAKTPQAATATLNGSYTVIVPGQFYSGSDIKIDESQGVETDEGTPSTLKLTTMYTHGIEPGSSIYLTNTIGSEIYDFTDTSTATAPDGRPYVDHIDTLNISLTPTMSLTETKQMTGMYAHKFSSSDVNTSNNTIRWVDHKLAAGDAVLYIPPSADTHIGGLQRFKVYYVKSAPDSNNITLCETTNGNYSGNATINFSSAGTSNFGRHQLILCYEMGRTSNNSNSYQSYAYTRYYQTGSGSGRDLYTEGYYQGSGNNKYGYWGLGGGEPDRTIYLQQNQSTNLSDVFVEYAGYYGTGVQGNSNMTTNKSGTTPDGWDFIEDFSRFDNYRYQNNYYKYMYAYSPGQWYQNYINYFDYSSSTNQNWSDGTTFCVWLKRDPEADSIFIPNHNLEAGTTLTLTKNSGNDIKYRSDTSTYYLHTPQFSTLGSGTQTGFTILDNNRIQLTNAQRINEFSGSWSFTGQVSNPTANSFYIGGNNLVTGQKIFASARTGGTLPTTTTGVSIPTTQSIRTVYDTVSTKLNAIKTEMGNDSTTIYYSGSSHYYPISSTYSRFDDGVQYMYYYQSTAYLYLRNQNGGWRWLSQSISNQDYRTGQPVDVYANSIYGGRGYLFQGTPYERNSNVPFHLEVYQRPYDPNLVTGVQNVYTYFSGWGYNYGLNGNRENNNNSYSSSNKTLGDGWWYTYDANHFAPNTTYHGMICISMLIGNDNWPGHYNHTGNSYYFPGDRYAYMYNFQYTGQLYEIRFWIPQKAGSSSSLFGSSGSLYTNAELAAAVATQVKSALTNPSFANAGVTTAFIKSIGQSRIGLKNNVDVDFNLTNSGTAPLRFQTEELTGAIDGYYSVDTTTNTQFESFLNAKVPKRTISIASTAFVTIDGQIYINAENHKLNNSQKLIYGGAGLTGINSGTTYYAISDGPNHFRLAETALSTGNPLDLSGTPTGVHTFEVASISGSSAGAGTIGITSTSKKITGTDCLFKRFFKTGETFKISDTTQNPPEYREFQVASVIDDNELTVTEVPGVTINSTNYYVDTKVYPRPDGTFIHRPFDGGVEITAGTSPNSSIVRQTRKYFRYQSGKGIQVSVAINFSPSRLANKVVGVANTTIQTTNYEINVNNSGSGAYNLAGQDRNVTVLGQNQTVTLMQGDTINFKVNATGHPFWIKSSPGTGTGNAISQGDRLTNNGTQSGTIVWDTSITTPGTYYYNCENHASMQGQIIIEAVPSNTNLATVTTKYPHGITRLNSVTMRGASDSSYNGSFNVKAADEFTFQYELPGAPTTSIPDGIIEYGINGYSNSAVRTGLFDYQNGMFFEYDGQDLYAVRRSSVQQLPGNARVTQGSNIVIGNDTNFSGQLTVGSYIVIRGQSYRITDIKSKTELHISPYYRGVDAGDVILTKTIDVKVPQSEWNIDKADGTGPSGFNLDINKIQMAYIDYSWYGAGKIRFGFKDAKGHVKYMHEFLHNNLLEEAYMRSGNIPGRYEIENTGNPSYVPSLFHWGTSVIMDGKFDDDKAYLFTAASNNLIFTNGDSDTATTTAASSLHYQYNYNSRRWEYYVRLSFNTSNANKFSTGTPLYTADEQLNGDPVSFTNYGSGVFYVYTFISDSRRWNPPVVYASIPNNTQVSIGAPSAGAGGQVNLNDNIPLISIRLAPSVDNNLTGVLGAREIINRMQLQLKSLGVTVSHDCELDVILNGAISNLAYENVTSPSLSQLVKHVAGDRVIGGTKIFSLRSSGGTENAAGKRLSATSDFDLSQITDLGNSILGGDLTFPNGPDLLTIAAKPVDTTDINSGTPLTISARISWTESQA